jgi:hypothetical protein
MNGLGRCEEPCCVECHDPDHVGLRRLITEYGSIEPGDTSWAGNEVALIYLEKQRLLEENRALRMGTRRSFRDFVDVVAITTVSAVLFLLFISWITSFAPRG